MTRRTENTAPLVRVGAATREQAVRQFTAAAVMACWERSDEVLRAGWNLPDEDIEVFDYELPGGRCLYSAIGMSGDVVFMATCDFDYHAAGCSSRSLKRPVDLAEKNLRGYVSRRRNSGRCPGAVVKVVVFVRAAASSDPSAPSSAYLARWRPDGGC